MIESLSKDTGVDVAKDPYSLDISFFNQKSYQGRGGQKRSFVDLFQSRLTRTLLEIGFGYKFISLVVPSLHKWLRNSWNVYSTLSQVSGSKYIVDSSKDRTLALLLQSYKPKDVHIVFLHRSIKGIAASSKRLAKSRGKDFKLVEIFNKKQDFEKTVLKYKKLLGNNGFTDIEYEDLTQFPTDFVNKIAKQLGSEKEIKMPNEAYFIEPNNSHIVAGNPMRYRGRQQVIYDDRWKSELSDEEKKQIESFLK